MTQTFHLTGGEITFEADKIVIKDDARKQNLYHNILGGMVPAFFAIYFVRTFKQGDTHDRWLFAILLIINLATLIVGLLRSTQREVPYNDIKTIAVKQRFSNKFIDIKLKNNRLRRVTGVGNMEEIEAYIQAHIKQRIGR